MELRALLLAAAFGVAACRGQQAPAAEYSVDSGETGARGRLPPGMNVVSSRPRIDMRTVSGGMWAPVQMRVCRRGKVQDSRAV